MDFMGLPVFTALKNKMQWHQARQGVLSQNIANAATPDYVAKDMRAPSGDSLMKPLKMASSMSFATFVTNSKHIQAAIAPSAIGGMARTSGSFEITPDGNSVVLEEQMSKIAGNQMDYEAATSLYTSNLGLLRTAMGGGGSR